MPKTLRYDMSPEKPRIDARLAQRLAQKKKRLDDFRPLPQMTLRRLHEDLRVMLTYHSNAIEGNSLTLRETQLVIDYGITADGHPLKDYLEASNHAEALDWLPGVVDASITGETILSLHRLVMQKIDPRAGELRQVQVYIRGANITPPPPDEVPDHLAQWLQWINGEEGARYEPLIRVAIAHHGFEYMHPFTDGNGRVGRLLLNLMLMQAGYPPAPVLIDWRLRYIQALDAANTGAYGPLVNLIGRAVELGLDLYLGACEASTAHLLPMGELAQEAGIAVDYLGWLARHGKLEATKRGRYWYASREAVERYLREADEEQRGRPRGHKSDE